MKTLRTVQISTRRRVAPLLLRQWKKENEGARLAFSCLVGWRSLLNGDVWNAFADAAVFEAGDFRQIVVFGLSADLHQLLV